MLAEMSHFAFRHAARLSAVTAISLCASSAIGAQPVAPRPASTTPPTLTDAKPLRLPAIVERTLPNGLKLVIVEHHELPIVDAMLVVRTGSEADGSSKAGLATLTADMLDEGAGTRDALALTEQAGFLAISLNTSAGFDASSVRLHSTKATIDSGMSLMADVVLRPLFAQKEFDRLKAERLTALLQEQDRGPAMASRAFSAIIYGDENPYGRSTGGTRSSVESITLSDVKNFWSSWYRPQNSTLVLVGDLSIAEAEAIARRAFGSWERATLPTVASRSSAPQAPKSTTVYIIDKPGAAQSSFRIGGVGVARNTPDYYPLMVLNTALGGSFTSRLNNTLREKKGYTYGASSSFAMRSHPGPFTASAEVVSAKTDSALIEFMNELKGIHTPLPPDELARAKRYLQLGYASRFESTQNIVSQITALVPYGVPFATLSQFEESIGRVSATDVKRVADQYITPDRFVVVIAGDRASIEPTIRATGIAPVEIRNAEGKPVIRP